MVADGKMMEVARVKITEAGRRAADRGEWEMFGPFAEAISGN